MTRAAEPGDALFDVFSFEVAFVAFDGVASAWDEMMASEHRDAATAQLTRLNFIHRPFFGQKAICGFRVREFPTPARHGRSEKGFA